MKKIFCKIITVFIAITIVTGNAQADEPRVKDLLGQAENAVKDRAVVVDLHTSQQWYTDAILDAFMVASSLNGTMLNKAYEFVWTLFEYSSSNGIVIASPAKLIEGCINGLKSVEIESDELIINKCSVFVVRAIAKHNTLVKRWLSNTHTAVSMNDADTPVCWDPNKDFGTYNEIFGMNELPIFLDAFATKEQWVYWGYYNCVKLSINEVRTRCESVLSNPETASKVNADPTVCQKYVEILVNTHNSRINYNNSVQGIK